MRQRCSTSCFESIMHVLMCVEEILYGKKGSSIFKDLFLWHICLSIQTNTPLTDYLGLILTDLTPFIHLFCSLLLQQSVKSSFVWSFGVIVSWGGQGYHSSVVINVGLCTLVDFGRRRLSSWACASRYHPGRPAPTLFKQTVSVMRALQIAYSHMHVSNWF